MKFHQNRIPCKCESCGNRKVRDLREDGTYGLCGKCKGVMQRFTPVEDRRIEIAKHQLKHPYSARP